MEGTAEAMCPEQREQRESVGAKVQGMGMGARRSAHVRTVKALDSTGEQYEPPGRVCTGNDMLQENLFFQLPCGQQARKVRFAAGQDEAMREAG